MSPYGARLDLHFSGYSIWANAGDATTVIASKSAAHGALRLISIFQAPIREKRTGHEGQIGTVGIVANESGRILENRNPSISTATTPELGSDAKQHTDAEPSRTASLPDGDIKRRG